MQASVWILLFSGCLWAQTTPTLQWTAAGPTAIESAALQGAPLGGTIQALARSTDGTRTFAGGDGGVWQLASGGWSAISGGQPVRALAMTASGILYAATDTGVFSDAGGSFQLVHPSAPVARLAIDPLDDTHVFAATQQGLDELQGGTWKTRLTGATTDVAWSGGNVLVATTAGLQISVDDGVSFGAVAASGLPAVWKSAALVPQPGAGFLALFNGATSGLYALTSDGTTAKSIALPTDALITLAASADDIWVGGVDLWQYDLSTQRWTNLTNTGSPGATLHGGQRAILSAPDGSLWLGGVAGVWWAPKNGAFENVNGGPPPLANAGVLSIALIGNDATPLAALDSGDLALGQGSIWSVTAKNAATKFTSLATDATSLFAASGDAILQSADSGQTWSTTVAAASSVTALAVAQGHVFYGTAGGQLSTGTSPDAASAVTALAAAANDATDLWLGTATGLWHSADGGRSWKTALSSPFTGAATSLAIDPLRPGVIAAAGSAGVFVTFNQGANWVAMVSGLPDAPITDLEFSSETLWAATLGRGLYTLPLANGGMSLSLSAASTSPVAGSTVALKATVAALGQPMAGATVSFTASGAPWQANATTDAQGIATVTYPVPSTTGSVIVTASTQGPGGTLSATVTLGVGPGAAARIIVVSGDNQSATNATKLPQPIVLEVADASGNPVSNQALTLSGPGSFNPAAATTDPSGRASINYVLPSTVGPAHLTATSGALTASWIETALATPDFILTLAPPSAPAHANQVATLTVAVAAVGNFAAPVTLSCSAPIPACASVSPSVVAPGGSATVTVDIGAFDANQTSETVQITGASPGIGAHTASTTVLIAGFTLAASASSVTANSGQSTGAIVLTVTPVNGLAGAVTFSAQLSDGGALPAGLTPQFSPATLALPAVTATSFTVAVAASSQSPPLWPLPVWFAACAWLALCGKRRRRWLPVAFALVSAACGGSAASAPAPSLTAPPPLTYPLVITATSGTLSATVPITLTVQR
ncbi:MAG TPA: hypothetical protein VN709_03435 [Terriglobales bacterium]|nr:hypothetical protein [Terriglobales bacterium]